MPTRTFPIIIEYRYTAQRITGMIAVGCGGTLNLKLWYESHEVMH